MQENTTITFLRNFPAWIPLLGLTIFFVVYCVITGNDAFKEWTSLVLASLFTALGIQRQSSNSPSANTTTGDINVSPETILENSEQIKGEKADV